MSSNKTITLLDGTEQIAVLEVKDRTLLELFVEEGLSVVSAPCGGNGICGNCKIQITKGESSPLHSDEERLLTKKEIADGIRLACRVKPIEESDLTVSLITKEREGSVRTSFIESSDQKREYRDWEPNSYGCAIDIGTTTVVVYLVDLATSEIIDHNSGMNSQRGFGNDVISRIQYSNEHDGGLSKLQKAITKQLDLMITTLLKRHAIDPSLLKEVVIAANPTMVHLLVGADPAPIAAAPYTPQFTEPQRIKASEIGFEQNSETTIYLPGLVSAYVGSDITVGAYSSHFIKKERKVLYIDIGTNGEMMLWDSHTLWACSSAAGPAFEGASIRQGMGATNGAVDRISLDENGELLYSTIGGKEAKGICGSGIIDTMALLLESGLVDETGALDDSTPSFSRYGGKSEDGAALKITDTLFFTNRDVREVQLAKAAVAAGVDVLMSEANLSFDELDEVIIAGGFGSYIDITSAQKIGLLPPIDQNKISAVGNAAGRGALEVLLLKEAQQEVENLRRETNYIELSSSPLFQLYFVERMMFE